MVGIDGSDRSTDLLCGLEHRSGELRAGVTVLVAVEEGGPATEQVAESFQLHAERGASGGSASRAPAALELEMQADLDAGVEQRPGIAVCAFDNRAHAGDGAHLD